MATNSQPLVGYQLALASPVFTGQNEIRPFNYSTESTCVVGNGSLYNYNVAGNGVFVRASRPGLKVCLPIAECDVRGLAPLEPYAKLTRPKVSAGHVAKMLELSRSACVEKGQPTETLFHLIWLETERRWRLDRPQQKADGGSVRPVDDGPDSSYAQALIEVHSHHQMAAFFSPDDDADEQGFRIYGVLGEIFSEPKFRVRVGCYGVFWEVPAEEFFELPPGIESCV